MTDDISKETFNPNNHYRKVIVQQGRVIIDSDLNEQSDIQYHYDTSFRQDIIGKSGTNNNNSGFKIVQDQNNLMFYKIMKGSYYVDGILCENEEEVRGSEQPDLVSYHLIDNTKMDKKNLHYYNSNIDYSVALEPGSYIVYLDVWDRHVTFLNDPGIRESALGGPDTSTRAKIVWQVKVHKVDINPEENTDFDWASSILEKEFTKKKKGKLSAEISNNSDCKDNTNGAYTGPANTLYRIEIHGIGDPSQDKKYITYKWSRDNATVVSKISNFDEKNKSISVPSFIKDKKYIFQPGDWVEITDDRHQLWRLPGVMVQLTDVRSSDQGFNLTYDLATIDYNKQDQYYSEGIDKNIPNILNNQNFNPDYNPIVRKWNYFSYNKSDNNTGIQGKLSIENGICIEFSDDGIYETGDYWLIPARTLTRNIEWPKNNAKPDIPLFCEPRGIKHHYSPIAIIENKYDQNAQIFDIDKIVNNKDNDELNKLQDFIKKTFNLKIDNLERHILDDEGNDNFIIQFGKDTDPKENIYHVIYNKKTKIVLLTQDNNIKISCGFVTINGKIYPNQISIKNDLRRFFRSATEVFSTTGIAKINYDIQNDQILIFGPFEHFLNVEVPPAILLGAIDGFLDKVKEKDNQERISFMDGFPNALLFFKAVLIDKESFCITLAGSNKNKLRESGIASIRIRWWAISSNEKGSQEKGLVSIKKGSLLDREIRTIQEHQSFFHIS